MNMQKLCGTDREKGRKQKYPDEIKMQKPIIKLAVLVPVGLHFSGNNC